jgi:hypothetical protein
MVIKVRLEGLNIVPAKGRFYVYFRDGGDVLLKGFKGNREALMARLAEPDLMGTYNAHRKRDLNQVFAEGTLGTLVAWFKNDCPRYEKLAPATRKDYDAAYDWLWNEFDAPLSTITTPALYEVRDRCAKQKWPRFADKMVAALSSMFTQAVKRGKMLSNPCLGMDKAHDADPNANREWFPEEWQFAVEAAPMEIRIPLMLARYAGLRVSYASWWKRNGANNSEVADLLGDKSERMGAHYTRHVEREANVIRAFERVKDKT